MSVPPGQVRGMRPATSGRVEGEVWLFLFFLTMVITPLSFLGFGVGVLLQRFVGVARRWIALAAGIWLVAYVAYRHWDLVALGSNHFRLYTEFLPAWMTEVMSSDPRPFRDVDPGIWRRAVLGSFMLGFPIGMLVSCIARMSRRTMHPEWSPKAIAEKERVHATKLEKATAAAAEPPDETAPRLFGSVMAGDLPWMVKVKGSRNGPWLQWPEPTLDWPRAFVGMPGYGKTFGFERATFLYAAMGRKVIFVDGKGTDPTLPQRIVQAYLAGSGNPYARVGLYPQVPMSIWRGSPRQVVQKVLAVWEFADQQAFFEAVAETGLALAIDVPGAPPVTSSEDLIARLDMKALERLHQRHGTPASKAALTELKSIKEWGFPGFAVRMRSLLRSIGSTLDGFWSFEDVDVAVITVPSSEKRKDASAIMRVILEDFLQYATLRKELEDGAVLIFDEFSALQGGRRTAVDAVERLRSTHTAVMLGAQSVDGLGNPLEARRLLSACSGGVVLFATPNPEEVVKLAGSIKLPSLTHNMDFHGLSDRGMVRPDSKFKVDPDDVRQYVPGECSYIVGGRASHLYVASTVIPTWTIHAAHAAMDEAERVHEAKARERAEANQEGNHEDNVRSLKALQEPS